MNEVRKIEGVEGQWSVLEGDVYDVYKISVENPTYWALRAAIEAIIKLRPPDIIWKVHISPDLFVRFMMVPVFSEKFDKKTKVIKIFGISFKLIAVHHMLGRGEDPRSFIVEGLNAKFEFDVE